MRVKEKTCKWGSVWWETNLVKTKVEESTCLTSWPGKKLERDNLSTCSDLFRVCPTYQLNRFTRVSGCSLLVIFGTFRVPWWGYTWDSTIRHRCRTWVLWMESRHPSPFLPNLVPTWFLFFLFWGSPTFCKISSRTTYPLIHIPGGFQRLIHINLSPDLETFGKKSLQISLMTSKSKSQQESSPKT